MFSSTIKISNLDDYISPSQDCIVVSILPKSSKLENPNESLQKTVQRVYSQVPSKVDLIKSTEKKTARVTLSDCLACSGCVTTAETILQQQQSVDEFLLKLKSAKCTVLALSPQSLVSLSGHFGVTQDHMHKALISFFEQYKLNVNYILEMELANQLVLEQCYQEFLNNKGVTLLSSECPGWACYAEKALDEVIIPHMSRVKSPQQVMGSLVKHVLARKLLVDQKDMLFVTVMPCYDKKVEAVRKEFEREGLKEVDVVLTTVELMDILKKFQFENIQSTIEEEQKQSDKEENNSINSEIPSNNTNNNVFPYREEDLVEKNLSVRSIQQLILDHVEVIDFKPCKQVDNPTGSNDYLDYIIARIISDNSKYQFDVVSKQGKNSDLVEVTLVNKSNQEVIYQFARVYGLKNIQNIARSLKQSKCKYQYIEIMACPSGCLNGGGQMRSLDDNVKPKQLVEQLQLQLKDNTLIFNNNITILTEYVLSQYDNSNSNNKELLFQTTFKHIPKMGFSTLNW